MLKKISPRTYKLMWDAHSATGIVIGLALFVIFFTGTLLLFRGEIRAWEEPALRNAPGGERVSLDAAVTPVIDSLSRGAPPSYLYMGLPSEDQRSLYLHMAGGSLDRSYDTYINPANGQWVGGPDEGALTQTLYYLHFFFQIGTWGLYLSGIVALFALLAVVTGTVVHFDRLVKDFFQFRPGKKLRVAWADAHKVLGTIGLPFQTMYALTGAYFGLVGLIALPYAALLFDGNMGTYYREAGYYAPRVQVDSVKAGSGPVRLERLAARASETMGTGFESETMIVHSMGQPNARVEVIGRERGTVFGGTGSVVYHGATGEMLARNLPQEAGALNEAVQSMAVLHFADFGGLALTVLFFLLGLTSCAVILTGNLTWLEVRRKEDRWVHRFLTRLTAGVATGMLPATALLFLADRLLPAGLPHVGWWGNAIFFGGWLLCVGYALARRNVARTHRALLVLGGGLALLMPVANGLSTGDWPWVAWQAGRWSVLGVDVGALLCGAAALGLAACLRVEAGDETGTGERSNAVSAPSNGRKNDVLLPGEASLNTPKKNA